MVVLWLRASEAGGAADARDTYPVPNFTTDVYLDHSGTDNGCVYAIPSRHLEGHIDLEGLDIDRLIAERKAARGRRDFAAADRIRLDLADRGILLEDGPAGTRWKRK